MEDSKRIRYLDMARGLGMLFVVMGHVEYINVDVRQWIAAFHMPLFFLLSGILIYEKREEKKNYIGTIAKKLRRIMIPYAVFSLLSFCVEGGRVALKGLDEWDVVLRQFFQSLCFQGVSTLWFLPALFVSEVVFIGVRKKTSHIGTIIISCVLVGVTSFLNIQEKAFYEIHGGVLRWELLHDVGSMLIRNFFCVGFVMVGYYTDKLFLRKVQKKELELLVFFLCAGVAILTIAATTGVDLRFMQLNFLPLYLGAAVSGAITVILGCRLLEKISVAPLNWVLEYYGRNSLIVMVTHMDLRVLYCSIKLAGKVPFLSKSPLGYASVIVLMVFLLEIPVIWIINHFFPFVLGKAKKEARFETL